MLLLAPVAFHVFSLLTETLHIFPVEFALEAVPELRLLFFLLHFFAFVCEQASPPN